MGGDSHKNGTLKLLPVVVDGPWIVKNMVTGKPTIIGNKLPVRYFYEPKDRSRGLAEYLEADLDVGNSSKTAKKIVSVAKRYMRSLTIDFGFVVQGNSKEELPEQMLGAVRLHEINPNEAPLFTC